MSWAKLPPPENVYGGYKGITVGFRAISYPKSLSRAFTELGWSYVNIEYNDDTNQIRFTPCRQFEGYKLTKSHRITAKVTQIIPAGKYMCFEEGKKEVLFTRYGN